jgi:hypothetical protein
MTSVIPKSIHHALCRTIQYTYSVPTSSSLSANDPVFILPPTRATFRQRLPPVVEHPCHEGSSENPLLVTLEAQFVTE